MGYPKNIKRPRRPRLVGQSRNYPIFAMVAPGGKIEKKVKKLAN
jgi:hypothetical protein